MHLLSLQHTEQLGRGLASAANKSLAWLFVIRKVYIKSPCSGELLVAKRQVECWRVALKILKKRKEKHRLKVDIMTWKDVPGNKTHQRSWRGALNRWKWRTNEKAQQPAGAVNSICSPTWSMNGYSRNISSICAAGHFFLSSSDGYAIISCSGTDHAKRRLFSTVGTCHSHK